MAYSAVLNNDINSQLMIAQEMRRRQNAARSGEGATDPDAGPEAASDSSDLRVHQRIARRAEELKQKAKDKLEEKVAMPIQQGTNWLLRSAWRSLILSWGLTLIWINIHVLLRLVISDKLFCKLGEEWIPKAATAITGKEAYNTAAKGVGMAEIIGLVLLNLVAVLIIFVFVGAILLVIDFATGWLGWLVWTIDTASSYL